MLDRIDTLFGLLGTHVATAGLALSMLSVAPVACWPQAAPLPSLGVQSPAQQSVPDQAPPHPSELPPAPPPSEENPGLINEIGKLFEKSKSIMPTIKSPSETIDDLNARAKGAGESLSNMAKPSSMVAGRAACLVAANGAPDCKAGPQTRAGRLQDRKLRDPGAMPIAHDRDPQGRASAKWNPVLRKACARA
jgi:hypothetical protein